VSSIKRYNPGSLKVPTKAYSNGVLIPLGVADIMFTTGQLSQNEDGTVHAPDDVEAQTRHIYKRIETILGEADMTLDHIVKAQIFVTNIEDGAIVAKVRDELLSANPPASTLLEVSKLLKPEYKVEIEVIAVKLNS